MILPFLILAALTIAGSVAAMSLRNLVHSVLALTLAFAGFAGLYLLLGAQFVGLAQILVYVGAVAILTAFVVLLTRSAETAAQPAAAPRWGAGAAVAGAVFAVLAWAVAFSNGTRRAIPPQPQVTVKQIGEALMGRFVVPLEVAGLLLTAALIGAVILAMVDHEEAGK